MDELLTREDMRQQKSVIFCNICQVSCANRMAYDALDSSRRGDNIVSKDLLRWLEITVSTRTSYQYFAWSTTSSSSPGVNCDNALFYHTTADMTLKLRKTPMCGNGITLH